MPSKAALTDFGRASDGVGVAAQVGIGHRPADDDVVPHAVTHRVVVAWVAAMVRGVVHAISIYLRHSEGLSQANLDILQHAAKVISKLRGPWITGGDWNMCHALLAS